MTAEQIILLADRKARKKGEKWTLNKPSSAIRCPNGRCPLEVAAGVAPGDYREAGETLGVKYNSKWQIIYTADNKDWEKNFDPALRSLMLNTFQFEEEGAK